MSKKNSFNNETRFYLPKNLASSSYIENIEFTGKLHSITHFNKHSNYRHKLNDLFWQELEL